MNPSEMFESNAFRELVEVLKGRYDMIVFDGARSAWCRIRCAGRVDGVIAVVRAGEVSRGTAARVGSSCGTCGAFMGVVLNAVQTHGAGYSKENYRTFSRVCGEGGERRWSWGFVIEWFDLHLD